MGGQLRPGVLGGEPAESSSPNAGIAGGSRCNSEGHGGGAPGGPGGGGEAGGPVPAEGGAGGAAAAVAAAVEPRPNGPAVQPPSAQRPPRPTRRAGWGCGRVPRGRGPGSADVAAVGDRFQGPQRPRPRHEGAPRARAGTGPSPKGVPPGAARAPPPPRPRAAPVPRPPALPVPEPPPVPRSRPSAAQVRPPPPHKGPAAAILKLCGAHGTPRRPRAPRRPHVPAAAPRPPPPRPARTHRRRPHLADARLLGDGPDLVDEGERVGELLPAGLEHRALGRRQELAQRPGAPERRRGARAGGRRGGRLHRRGSGGAGPGGDGSGGGRGRRPGCSASAGLGLPPPPPPPPPMAAPRLRVRAVLLRAAAGKGVPPRPPPPPGRPGRAPRSRLHGPLPARPGPCPPPADPGGGGGGLRSPGARCYVRRGRCTLGGPPGHRRPLPVVTPRREQRVARLPWHLPKSCPRRPGPLFPFPGGGRRGAGRVQPLRRAGGRRGRGRRRGHRP